MMLRCFIITVARISQTLSMRTTIDLDPELLTAAKKLAAAQSQSLGAVISQLAKLGLEARRGRGFTSRSGFPIFKVRKGAAPISLEDVKRDEDST